MRQWIYWERTLGVFWGSDRYRSYNWVDVSRRQLCWAHLKREFQKISERSGASRQVGRDLMAQEKKLFRLWRKLRDGTLSRKECKLLVLPIIEVEDLEPTNNSAERAIRPAVLWKKTSFGSQSENGSIFVARMLTVVSSLRSQNRSVLEFIRETITAHRQGISTPSLIPTAINSEDREDAIVTSNLERENESIPLVA